MGAAAHRFNLICDFDLPTLTSGYNDAATSIHAANPTDADAEKWRRLFALQYFDGDYPQHGTRFFNAVVALFNALPAGQVMPAVRLWKR
jgi:hypothetical protein